jgi:hypothetical protein
MSLYFVTVPHVFRVSGHDNHDSFRVTASSVLKFIEFRFVCC